LKIKYYKGADVEELGLTMTVAENNLGVSEEVELVKDGGNIPVTNENRLFYISSYSNYMLNTRTYQ
jgi:ubiquitin-protein ligase E3 C